MAVKVYSNTTVNEISEMLLRDIEDLVDLKNVIVPEDIEDQVDAECVALALQTASINQY